MGKVTLWCFIVFLRSFVECQTPAERFRTSRIVPDIIDIPPDTFLNVTYPTTGPITFGRIVGSGEVSTQPQIAWQAQPNTTASTWYTLLMVDPDAPGARMPTYRSVKHWLVSNIQANANQSGNVISSYVGPQPPARTGNHRYVFLLYPQNGTAQYSEPTYRKSFNVRRFVQQYGLANPVAGNMFITRF